MNAAQPLPRSAQAAALEAEFDQLTAAFEMALGLAAQGEMLELNGLEARVERACRDAQSLEPAEARAMVTRLGELVGLLDRLAAALVQNFGNIPQDAETTPRTAAEAYGKGSGGRGQR